MIAFSVCNLHENIQKYQTYLKQCVETTPYHNTEYLLAEETAEDYPIKVFLYKTGEMFAMFLGIVRKVNDLPYMNDLGQQVYDMVAPHEYAGVISNNKNDRIKTELLNRLDEYCVSNSIICQFFRLNPYFLDLPLNFKKAGYDVTKCSSHVFVDLKHSQQTILSSYKSDVRTNLKRASEENLIFEIAEKTKENIYSFRDMYVKAMDFLDAKKFLYFNKSYFEKLLICDFTKICFIKNRERKIIAGSILLTGKKIVYYHLSCFDREYALLRPMDYLLHSMILWCKKEGYEILHLGGGAKGLLHFKKKFSSGKIDYYTSSKVNLPKLYKKVCDYWKDSFQDYQDEVYFPIYRYNE